MVITFKNTNKTLENFDAERGLLACCGISTEALHEAMDQVRPDWFTLPLHAKIWEKLVEVSDQGDCLDLVVQLEMPPELQEEIRDVFDSVETAGHWKAYLNKLHDSYRYRKVKKYVLELSDMVNEGTQIDEILNHADRGATELLQSDSSKIRTGAEVVQSTIERIKERRENGVVSGIKSGIPQLDFMTQGFKAGQLVVVCARTSMGKTAYAVDVAVSCLRQEKRLYFISLEMEAEEVMQRMQVNHSGVPIKPIEDDTANAEQKQKFSATCKFFNKEKAKETLWIDDDSCLSFMQIRARGRKLARKGLDMIIVDYAQIVQSDPGRDKESDYVRVSYVSRSMKILARELGVPVILLAQLSRKADEPNRKPRLSDLKESGGLEQDADIVLGLWRKDDEKIEERTLSVLKQRNGRVGDIDLKFIPHLQRFTNQPRLN